MIPKIIHHTWKDDQVPEKYQEFYKKAINLHPDWQHILWTDEMNLKFVRENFPDVLPYYKSFPKNIMRADMIRYLIMDKMGGLYLDLDYEMLKPYDLLDYDLVLPYNRQISFGDKYDGLGNSIFASSPGHLFWKYLINDIIKIDDHEKFYKSLSSQPYITWRTTLEEAITGPGLITRIYFLSKDNLKNVHLPHRTKFHPEIPTDAVQYNALANNNSCYGIHHCYGSWRDKSILKKIKRRLTF